MTEQPIRVENAAAAANTLSRDTRPTSETEFVPAGDAGDRANILLVDDRPDKSLAMQTVLADLGQNVVKAGSGKEALRCLLEKDFAVILLDVNMPGLDGFETAHLIRQRQSLEHTPIIFITGISDTENARLPRICAGSGGLYFDAGAAGRIADQGFGLC